MVAYRPAVFAASPVVLALALALAGCGQQAPQGTLAAPGSELDAAAREPGTGSRPVPTLGPDEALPGTTPRTPTSSPVAAPGPPAAGTFDPATVPESQAALPPFPFFEDPAGLEGMVAPAERDVAFDREHMIAGDRVVVLEGRVFRERYRLAGTERTYTELEFQRNYADAIAALGGVEVSQVQYTRPVNEAFGGRAAVDRHYHGTCASDGCENHTYLIRQDGREYWVQVSTGAIPPHGQLTVLERQAMGSSLALIDAATMQQALDHHGRIALQVNFDVDKATLRPDAEPVIAEITELLRANPQLRLSIDGHTDATGDPVHNRDLSQARAERVRAELLARGIAGERLQARGFGADQPVADNASADGRARNRRVELVKLG